MMKLYHRIRYFFDLWGTMYYDERIGVGFAWALAGAMASVHDELTQWGELI